MKIDVIAKLINVLEELKTELEKDKEKPPARCPGCNMSIKPMTSEDFTGHILADRPYLLPVTNQYTGQSGNLEFCSRACQSSFEDTYVRYK